jgi:hypothetical protein
LVSVPGEPSGLTPGRILDEFGISNGHAWGLQLLRDAIVRRDPIDVELALIACFQFGFSEEHLDLLSDLAFAEWHHSHEDAAVALGQIGTANSVAPLQHLAIWVPEYLEFDDARALSSKAIWALGSNPADAARAALEQLAASDSDSVARKARAQLEK